MSSRIQKTGVNGECQAYVLQERAVQTQRILVSLIYWAFAMGHVVDSRKIGPLCTADACAIADQERERIMSSHRAFDAIAQKQKEKEENSEAKKQENLEKSKQKEAEWKQKEAAEDAAMARKAQAEQAQLT